MVQVVQGGREHFNAMAYGRPHPGTLQFIHERAHDFSSMVTERAQQFVEGVGSFIQWVDESKVAKLVRDMGRKVAGLWDTEDIRYLTDLDHFQNASLTMQRWVMAEPTVRKKFHNQQLHGYADTYIDAEPGCRGEDHYDYRRVMDGIVVETEDGWKATSYIEELKEDDYHLIHAEQIDIQQTWDNMLMHLKHGKKDPTDRHGNSL